MANFSTGNAGPADADDDQADDDAEVGMSKKEKDGACAMYMSFHYCLNANVCRSMQTRFGAALSNLMNATR